MDHPESRAGGLEAANARGRVGFLTLGMMGRSGCPTAVERRRAFRVWLLVATIVVLSVADLYMTLAHLRSVGMGEANPLARLVISYQSPMLLSVWKLACVGLASLIFLMARFRRSSEVACWGCCVVMTALTIHWIQYSNEAMASTPDINTISGADGPPDWVSMGSAGQAQ